MQYEKVCQGDGGGEVQLRVGEGKAKVCRKTKDKLKIVMLGHKRIPSCEGGIEVVVEELATHIVAQGNSVTCFNRAGHHVSGVEYDMQQLSEYRGVCLKKVPTWERKGLAAVTSSFFALLLAAVGRYDVVHIYAKGTAAFYWVPKLFWKRVTCTIHDAAVIIGIFDNGRNMAGLQTACG